MKILKSWKSFPFKCLKLLSRRWDNSRPHLRLILLSLLHPLRDALVIRDRQDATCTVWHALKQKAHLSFIALTSVRFQNQHHQFTSNSLKVEKLLCAKVDNDPCSNSLLGKTSISSSLLTRSYILHVLHLSNLAFLIMKIWMLIW